MPAEATDRKPETRYAGAVTPLAYQALGDGPVLVYLHGGGPGCTSWLDFREVARRLGPGWRHLFVDLAQYGASAAEAIDGPALDFHASCLLSLLDELSIGRAHVVAQSLGGSVALNLAALAPDRLDRIVVTASQPVAHPSANPALGAEARRVYYGGTGPSEEKMRELLARLEWCDAGAIPASTVRERYAASTTPWALAVADGSGRGEAQELSDRLAEIPHDVLWVWGAQDPFAPPAYALDVAAAMRRADVAVLAGTAHHPQEERPSVYARLVREFLTRDATKGDT
ncbi:alpha/beta fold hydrolase [Micromonospora endophytica]|uniref:Hydrolase n=1 Tax=Micromonospora endophytica TaxID=515350 RepID=A0A2W2D643_9ACTN|nr:alpha/beta hydrolase [Micromonospora endophytica]PZF92646.1 hydrolase [Micromonospora endophytica]RIW49828.1 alpha/beta fold hydrolase [Micromonospora endophytica]BCJ57242.1 4,5:9,10-diseco-3-hydroxy-5,9,17-trioxoandrosta-1 (10),2-diene-4-oate hydrolase [Micromonospora endophytica]